MSLMKKIGGKHYHIAGLFTTKVAAKQKAHKLRSKGYSVRVIKGASLERDLWVVYKRAAR